MQMQQRTADPDFAGKPADIISPSGGERRDHSEPMDVGECRKSGKQLVSIVAILLFHAKEISFT
jgi:hypothetical protein